MCRVRELDQMVMQICACQHRVGKVDKTKVRTIPLLCKDFGVVRFDVINLSLYR